MTPDPGVTDGWMVGPLRTDEHREASAVRCDGGTLSGDV